MYVKEPAQSSLSIVRERPKDYITRLILLNRSDSSAHFRSEYRFEDAIIHMKCKNCTMISTANP